MGSRSSGFAVFGLAAFLGLAACSGASTEPGSSADIDGGGPSAEIAGSVTILLTDHPSVDLKEAWVEITGIYLQGRLEDTNGEPSGPGGNYNGDNETLRNRNRERYREGPGDCDCEPVWLLEESTGWIDLLTLAQTWVSLVEDAEVPAGTYGQLRFVLGDAAIVTEGGRVYATPGADLESLSAVRGAETTADGELHCPSCSRSGLKVAFRGGIEVGDDADAIFMVDFDVTQSFGHPAGRSGRWIMHPVMMGTKMSTAGAIAGAVLLDGLTLPSCDTRPVTVEDFVPTAEPAGDATQYTGDVDSEGAYEIAPLDPGAYDLGYLGQVDVQVNSTTWTIGFNADHPATANVPAGGIVEVNYTITSADCNSGG